MSKRLWSLVFLSVVAWGAASCSKDDSGPSGPATPADTTAPFITAISPDSNNFNVALSTPIVITVSEKLDASTVNGSSVVLSGGGLDTVPTTVSCSDNIITVTPTPALPNAGLYQLDVTRAVEDKAGNGLREAKRIAFGVEPYTTTSTGTWVRRIRPSLMSPDLSLSSVVVKQDGSYAVSGYSTSGGSGVYTAGLDATGAVSWLQLYYKDYLIHSQDLMERQDGFLIGCGIANNPSNTGFVYGTTQLGTPAFDYSYSGQAEWAHLYSIIEAANYGAVVCGVSGSYPTKAYLIKTTPYGGPVWQRYLGANGSSYFYCAYGLAATGSGYMLCGTVSVAGVPPISGLVIKTNDTGIAVWEKTYGPATFEDIVSLTNGLFAVTGTTSGNHIVIVAIDSAGTEQWRTDIGAGTGHAIAALTDGGCVIAGESGGKVVIAKLSSTGSLAWRRDLIDGSGHSVAVAQDGGFIIAVGPRIITTDKTYVIKTDPNGNL